MTMEELTKEWRMNAHNIRLVLPDHGEAAVWDHCADELEATLREGGYGFSDEPIAPHQQRYLIKRLELFTHDDEDRH